MTLAGGVDLDLEVLVLARLDRDRAQLLRAVRFHERGLEPLRRLRHELHKEVLVALVRDGELIFEARCRRAVERGQLRLDAELRRQILAGRDVDRQVGGHAASLGVDDEVLRPRGGAPRNIDAQIDGDVLVGRRHRRGDGRAAAQQHGVPALGRAIDAQGYPLGRQIVVLQLHLYGGGLADAGRDRGIVGREEKPLYVRRCSCRLIGGAHDGRREKREQYGEPECAMHRGESPFCFRGPLGAF